MTNAFNIGLFLEQILDEKEIVMSFEDLDNTSGYGYEIDPSLADELGAFKEDAIDFEDIEEAIEDES